MDETEHPATVTADGKGRYIVAPPKEYGKQRWHDQPRSADRPGDTGAQSDLVKALAEGVRAGGGELPGGLAGGVILDLGQVDYMNSAAIGSIFSLRKFVKAQGARMVVARPTPAIVRLLNTVNLPSLLPLASSIEEAQARLAELNEALGEMEKLESSAKRTGKERST